MVASKRNLSYGLSINRTMSILVTYEQGVIKVFDDNDRTPFIAYTDPHPLTIRHVAICKFTTEGRFVIHIL